MREAHHHHPKPQYKYMYLNTVMHKYHHNLQFYRLCKKKLVSHTIEPAIKTAIQGRIKTFIRDLQ